MHSNAIATIELERIERPTTVSFVFDVDLPAKAGWGATITLKDGSRLLADRVDGEDGWHVNGVFKPRSSFPIFWNGWLSRCTIPHMLGDDMAADVEDALP